EFETGNEDDKKKRSLQDKSVKNILSGIEASKQVPFERLLFALGIRMVGETVAKKLARHFISMDRLATATMEELKNVYEIGESIAGQIIRFFSDENNLRLIDKM